MKITLILGLIALMLVYGFCLATMPAKIEAELDDRSNQVLQDKGFDWAEVTMDGRDAVLQGVAPNDTALEQAKAAVREVDGIRVLDSRTTLAEPEPIIVAKVEPEPIIEIPPIPPLQPPAPQAIEKTEAAPAELSEAEQCEQQFKQIFAEQQILFQINTSNVRPDSRGVLEALTSVAKSCQKQKLVIAGHTDSRGNNRVNQRLSKARADAIKSYFVSQGIEASMLSTIGHGEAKPIADNGTATGRAQNRRIEISIGG